MMPTPEALFEPTFNAVIEPHPTPVVDLVDEDTVALLPPPPADSADASENTPEGVFPTLVHRQNASNTPETSPPQFPGITKRPPRRPIKRDADAIKLEPIGDCKREIHFADPVAPMQTEAYDPIALFQALGAAFAVGAITGTLLMLAFSKRTVEELAA